MKMISLFLGFSISVLLLSGCVSRTSTIERGVGEDVEQKKTVWIWQDEYRD